MNIFGFFLFLRFHTYYKSADDIKNIRNKLLSVQVTLLMFSSILMSYIYDFRIPVKVKGGFKMSTRLFSHYLDIIKDILFLANIFLLLQGGSFFLKWVRYFS